MPSGATPPCLPCAMRSSARPSRTSTSSSRSSPWMRSTSWRRTARRDRKSTRLNSSHTVISYAVFCLKKKKKKIKKTNKKKKKKKIKRKRERGRKMSKIDNGEEVLVTLDMIRE